MGKSRRAEALALLGIARRAGAVVKGTDATRRGLRKRIVRLVLLADDASETQIRKVVPLARARGVPLKKIGDRSDLGAALGDASLTAVGVTGTDFSRQLQELLGRD